MENDEIWYECICNNCRRKFRVLENDLDDVVACPFCRTYVLHLYFEKVCDHSFVPIVSTGMIDPRTGKYYYDEEKCEKCGHIEYLDKPVEIDQDEFLKYFSKQCEENLLNDW